jgi:hypothetical protein
MIVGSLVSNWPNQTAIFLYDPILLVGAMGTVGPGLQEDIVIQPVDL